MNRLIRIISLFTMVAWSGMATAVSIQDCEVSGSAELLAMDTFDGTFSDLDGVETIYWTHDWTIGTTSFSFEADVLTGSDDIVCRFNGFITGTVLSTGTATVNGVPGYSYRIFLEDNRPPPNDIPLTASLTYDPTDRTDGVASFATPRTAIIPTEIPVTVGGSSDGKTRLVLDDIHCTYLGTGITYTFDRCNDPLDSGYAPGDHVDVSQIRLRIQQADRSFAETSVEIDIGTGPQSGQADRYQIAVEDPMGNPVHNRSESVINGDISITLIPPTP